MRQAITKIGIVLSSAGAALIAPMAHAQLTTSTLASSIDTVNTTFVSYFTVLLTSYWPFVVGVGILAVVWRYGRSALGMFR